MLTELYKKEIIKTINENDYNDIFVNYNYFFAEYKVNLYIYLRVSTEKQDFGRQIIELYKWAKEKNVKIFIEHIFCEKYTGKTIKRPIYQELKKKTKKNDYLLVTEVSRLGRNRDDTKREWHRLKGEDINILVMEFGLLSSPLPNEPKEHMSVDKKFLQDIIFNALLYSACKKIEEVSKSTKNGLEKAKKKGKVLGKKTNLTINDFVKTLEYNAYGLSVNESIKKTKYPKSSYIAKLKENRIKYQINDKIKLLEIIKREVQI